MKRSSNLGKSEAGQVLVYVTIVLMLTLVIIPPLLGFVSGAGRTAQIREDRMLHVYAADAGIEDAYQWIMGNLTDLPDPWTIEDVNGYDVAVAIYEETEEVYRIVSTATSDSGAGVTIEAWAAALDFQYLLDSALSSYGDLTLKPGVEIYGDVTYNGELDNKGDILGNTTKGVPSWPDEDDLKDLYYGDVEGQTPYGSSLIDIQQDETMGPLYREGSLSIYSSSSSTPTLTLGGTFYVTGDLDIGKINQDFVLDLNGQTIFSEQTIDIGGKCTVTGSGCIIALGNIFFSPQVQSGPDDFVFILSVNGNLQAQPGGDFYGAMAGLVEITSQPGSTIHWREYLIDDLNFPEGDPLPGIRAYIIRY